jgi:hypothetical protein
MEDWSKLGRQHSLGMCRTLRYLSNSPLLDSVMSDMQLESAHSQVGRYNGAYIGRLDDAGSVHVHTAVVENDKQV